MYSKYYYEYDYEYIYLNPSLYIQWIVNIACKITKYSKNNINAILQN